MCGHRKALFPSPFFFLQDKHGHKEGQGKKNGKSILYELWTTAKILWTKREVANGNDHSYVHKHGAIARLIVICGLVQRSYGSKEKLWEQESSTRRNIYVMFDEFHFFVCSSICHFYFAFSSIRPQRSCLTTPTQDSPSLESTDNLHTLFAFDSHGSIIYCIRLFFGFLLISEEALFLLRSSMRSWWKDAYVGTKAGNQFICHSHLMIPKPTNTFPLSHVWLHPQRASYSNKGRTHLFPRHSSRFSRLGPHEHSPRVGSWGITSFDYDTVPSFPCYTYNIDN